MFSRSHRAQNSLVIGSAGASLSEPGSSAWTSNDEVARIGAAGEQRTAAVLDRLAAKHPGVAVLHDLTAPTSRYSANIDHVVVSGRRVFILDTKVWTPGRYWTFRGRSYRGLRRFRHADFGNAAGSVKGKRAVQMSVKLLASHLERSGCRAKVISPALVLVWPSRAGKSSFTFLRYRGAKVVDATRFARKPSGYLGTEPADVRIVAALAPLCHGVASQAEDDYPTNADPIYNTTPATPTAPIVRAPRIGRPTGHDAA